MGLLKHAILPAFALLDLLFLHQFLIKQDYTGLAQIFDRDLESFPMTDFEVHLLHCIGGVCVLLAINNIVAIVMENSHYRGMAVLLHTIFFACDAGSYVALGRLGGSEIGTPLVIMLMGVIGLVVHSMEPGIFTKDKNGGGKKKK